MGKIEITLPFASTSSDGMREVVLRFYMDDGRHGHSAEVNVWIHGSDSVSQMQMAAVRESRAFLSHALSALDAEYPPQPTK